MHHEPSSSKHLIRGASSVGTILAVLVAVLIGYLTYKVQDLDKRVKAVESKTTAAAAQDPNQQQQPVDIAKVKELFNNKNIAFGDAKRKVLFVEFSDPSCPYCHIASGINPEIAGDQFKTVENGGSYIAPVPAMKKLVDEGKASLVILYANGHGNGEITAQALYCAQEKGKYWEAHNMVYDKAGYDLINGTVKNDKAQAPALASYLAPVVDPTFMTECISSGKYATKIAADMAKAQELGFGGTPMFLINGERFNGAYSFKDMEPVVNKFLN